MFFSIFIKSTFQKKTENCFKENTPIKSNYNRQKDLKILELFLENVNLFLYYKI